MNDLVDRVNIFNKQPKNKAGRNQEINEIRLAANELGLKFDDRAAYRDWETDRKSTRLNSSHSAKSRMPSSA